MMHTTIRRSLAGAALLTTMLTACGTSSATPSPVIATRSIAPVSPVPVSSTSQTSASVSSPASSGTPSASASAGGYDPALVAEAEKVFRDNQLAFLRWQQRGGSSVTPPEFASLAAGNSLVNVGQLLRMQKQAGWRLDTEPMPSVFAQGVLPGLQMSDSEIAIGGCVDGSHTMVIQRDGQRSRGVILQYRAYFRHFAGLLKEVDEQSREVSKC